MYDSSCPGFGPHAALAQAAFCPGSGRILLQPAWTCLPALLCFKIQLANCVSVQQDLAPGQGVQLDEVEGGKDELKENPASSRNPKEGLPKVCTQRVLCLPICVSSFQTTFRCQQNRYSQADIIVVLVLWHLYMYPDSHLLTPRHYSFSCLKYLRIVFIP